MPSPHGRRLRARKKAARASVKKTDKPNFSSIEIFSSMLDTAGVLF
jgi:hypothetical protein